MLVIEDLYVKGLIKNKKQSRHWADLAHGAFQRLLKYKSRNYGALLVEADRWFPSSKLCSNCLRYHSNLTLKDRTFHCSFCGLTLDRDYNAALNLVHYFHCFILSQVTSHIPVAESSAETLNACEETVSPVSLQTRLDEAGRQALAKTGHTRPSLSSLGKSFRTVRHLIT
ncbi:MAG: RNA-guided endonuclease InsQ/TnpB family protein [Candidatus Thorarchaeota archaeon]